MSEHILAMVESMKVGDSVRMALNDFESEEYESAVLHACNAIDGTAKKASAAPDQVGKRFVGLLVEYQDVLERMGMPGIDVAGTKFPTRIGRGPCYQMLDLPSLIYKIHRCTHGHGDELPDGFDLIPERKPGVATSRIDISAGTIQLPTSIILGLLAVAVLHPVNHDQTVDRDYFLFSRFYSGPDGPHGRLYMPIQDWWGRAKDYRHIAQNYPPIQVTMNFDNAVQQIKESGGSVVA